MTRTGYDLAILMRPSGEARFANVRKLMRLAADYEAVEGRDLRGFLDFLAARADADADAQAATAVEGHDGVRIMTIHGAKGLEFGVVAIPHLSRGLLPAVRTPLLTLGHEPESPRVGMQLRRLGARGVNLYEQRALCEDLERRQAEEELRLFHVGATRARERLLLSGVIAPSPPSQMRNGTSVIERIATGFEIDREADSAIAVAAPEARPGLDEAFGPSTIPVRVNRPSVERAEELRATRAATSVARETGEGPAPLVARRPTGPTRKPLSYTAITAALGEGSEERLVDSDRAWPRPRTRTPAARSGAGPSTRCSSGARRGTGRCRPPRSSPASPGRPRSTPTRTSAARRCSARSRPGSTRPSSQTGFATPAPAPRWRS